MTTIITVERATKMGLVPYSGPYAPADEWMVGNALHDIARNNRDLGFMVASPVGEGYLDIYIQPNKFYSASPYTPLSAVLSKEHRRSAKETLFDVEDSQDKVEALQRQAQKATAGLRRYKEELLGRARAVRVVPEEKVDPNPPQERQGGWDANGSELLDGGVL